MSDWITVAKVSELAPGQWRTVDADGAQIVVFNLDGEYFAIDDVCTHDGGQLTGGTVKAIRSSVRATARASASAPGKPCLRQPTSRPQNFRCASITHSQVRDDRWD